MLPEYMLTYPTVFAAGDQYQIFVPFSDEVILWIEVGGRRFYDHCCGILRSGKRMHKAELPMRLLDEAGEYTVVYKKMIDRRPYFPLSEPERRLTVPFRPVPTEGDIRIVHISDAHNLVAEPVAAGQAFPGGPDLLILNGDIPNHSGCVENFNAICEIASGITEGRCPVVFARGNHDTRGICAEDMPHYIPTVRGQTYYTFRVGCVWGLVLDCGEDKRDTNEEYGGTICFHDFRVQQTDFIRNVIADAAREYEAPGVRHRLVISHIGFTHVDRPPFDIEEELYREWTALLREHVRPDLLLYGHYHRVEICPPGCEFDSQGQPCTAIIGSKPIFDKEKGNGFVGCALTLRDDGTARVLFRDHTGAVLTDEIIR